MHLVVQGYLSPYAVVIPQVVNEGGDMYKQEVVEALMALAAALLRIVQMIEYNGFL